VLVTGSSGFVGAWMLRHLAEAGDKAVTLGDDVDIRDRPAVAEAVAAAAPDAVCHLAAQASVGQSWQDEGATFAVNALGVVHLLDAVAGCERVPRVLLVSSAEVYGRVSPESLPLREDLPFAPNSPYGASKAAAELVGLQAWLGRGIEVVRARPFNHTGAGQPGTYVVPSIARQVVAVERGERKAVEVGNLDVRRDISDVRDVVRAYRLLLEQGEPGAVYNVCRGSSISIAEVAGRLLALAGVDAPVRVDPALVRPVDLPELRGDPARLHAAAGWSPAIDLDGMLADVLAAWRAA